MKKLLLITLFVIAGISLAVAQTTATNFTTDDCDGVSHDLYAELDAEKVVVMAWVMPCGACIGGSLTAYNIAQSYEVLNPGRVVYYLIDDYGNTDCTVLTNWGTTNGIGPDISVFSTSDISMGDYGTPGMPKVVVVGGTDHTIYFNENNAAASDIEGLEAAIEAALEGDTSTTGISDNSSNLNVSAYLLPLM